MRRSHVCRASLYKRRQGSGFRFSQSCMAAVALPGVLNFKLQAKLEENLWREHNFHFGAQKSPAFAIADEMRPPRRPQAGGNSSSLSSPSNVARRSKIRDPTPFQAFTSMVSVSKSSSSLSSDSLWKILRPTADQASVLIFSSSQSLPLLSVVLSVSSEELPVSLRTSKKGFATAAVANVMTKAEGCTPFLSDCTDRAGKPDAENPVVVNMEMT